MSPKLFRFFDLVIDVALGFAAFGVVVIYACIVYAVCEVVSPPLHCCERCGNIR